MPIYEYECAQCKIHYEVMQKIKEQPLKICQYCGGKLKKMISNTTFVLKGTGWYATDYASNKANDETRHSPDKPEIKPESRTDQNKESKAEEKSEKKESVISK